VRAGEHPIEGCVIVAVEKADKGKRDSNDQSRVLATRSARRFEGHGKHRGHRRKQGTMHANEKSQDGVQAEEPGVTERKSNWRWRRLLTSLRSVICARNRRVLRRCAPLFPVWLVATDIKPVGGVAGKPNLRSRGANGFRI